jgi:hypothetical protein
MSSVRSDWQTISFSPRSIDELGRRPLHKVYAYRNCYDDALRPELFHVHWGTTGAPLSTYPAAPFWTKEASSGEPSSVASICTLACRSRKVVITSQRNPLAIEERVPTPQATGFAASHLAHGADRIIDIKHGEAHRPRKRPPPPSGRRRWGAAPKRVLSKGPVMPSRPGEFHPEPLTEP